MIEKRDNLIRIIVTAMVLVLAMTFIPQNVVAASTVKLNKKEVTLIVGKTTTLKVKNATKKVKWSTSKKRVATVSDNGKVTAKKAGTAKITAKVGDKKYTCKVTVQAKLAELAEENEVVTLVNIEREKLGLSPLVMDAELQKAAAQRAQEIVENFSHLRPNGEICFTVFQNFDITYMAAGENIAAGQPNAASVVYAWMNSEDHKRNILSEEYGKIGVGLYKVSNDAYGYYWVQMFTD